MATTLHLPIPHQSVDGIRQRPGLSQLLPAGVVALAALPWLLATVWLPENEGADCFDALD